MRCQPKEVIQHTPSETDSVTDMSEVSAQSVLHLEQTSVTDMGEVSAQSVLHLEQTSVTDMSEVSTQRGHLAVGLPSATPSTDPI